MPTTARPSPAMAWCSSQSTTASALKAPGARGRGCQRPVCTTHSRPSVGCTARLPRLGGDPTRITLVGQSAGGNVIAALLASGAVDALVAGAIIQSGPPSAQPAKRAGRITNAIVKRLGISATRDAFLAKTPDELVAAQEAVTAGTTPVTAYTRSRSMVIWCRQPRSIGSLIMPHRASRC